MPTSPRRPDRRLAAVAALLLPVLLVSGLVPAAEAGPLPRPTFVREILSPGLADVYPADVTATSSHYYVMDPGRYRVIALDRVTGAIDAELGSGKGKGEGQFSAGRGIGVDSNDDVYVADTANNRIQKLSPALEPLTTFGSKGSGPGQFLGVYDVAAGPGFDETGAPTEVVYATDNGGGGTNGRIAKFDTAGRFIGTVGAGLGFRLRQIAVAPDGTVYVTDGSRPGVRMFDAAGNYLRFFGGRGTADGKFGGDPRGIGIAPNGDVYVTDSNNYRVQVFSSTGKFKFAIAPQAPEPGAFGGPKGLVVTSDGVLMVADLWGYGLIEFTQSGTWLRTLFGTRPPDDGVNTPRGLDVDETGRVFVLDWWHQRVVRVNADGSGPQPLGGTATRNDPGGLNFPWDVKVQPGTGILFIANRESHEIEVLNPDGSPRTDFGTIGSEANQLRFPQALAFAPDGTLLVSDSENHRLVRFALDSQGRGTQIATYGEGLLKLPGGIATAPDGTIWVADSNNNTVRRLDPSGQWTSFTAAVGLTTFRRPWGVTVGPDGNIWIADTGKNRVIEMTPDGTALAVTSGAFDGKALDAPSGIAFSADGSTLYVADRWNNRVLELRPPG